MVRSIGISAILGMVALGCGRGPAGNTDSGSGDASTSGEGTDGTTTSTSTTSTTLTSSVDTLSSATQPEPTTGEPAPACGPPREPAQAYVLIDGSEPFTLGDVRFELACTVASIAPGPGSGYTLGFDCVDQAEQPVAHTLAFDLEPAGVAPLAVGESVRLRVHNDNPFHANAFITVRDPQGALLLAYASAELLPSAFTDEHLAESFPTSDFFAPLVMVSAWPCEPECEPVGGDFIEAGCPCKRRGAIDFDLAGETVRVFEDEVGELAAANFDLRVHAARMTVVEDCDPGSDFNATWFRLLATRRR